MVLEKKKQRNQKIFTNLWETVQLWHPVGPKYHSATCKTHWQCGKKVQGKNCCGVQLRLTHILSDTHTSNIYLTNTHSHTLTRIRPICKYRGVWMVLGRSWGKWRLLSACTCVCIQYKSKHVCLRLSTLEQYDESGYWLKGSLSFYQQIVPPTVVIIPMWTHTFTHSHAHRDVNSSKRRLVQWRRTGVGSVMYTVRDGKQREGDGWGGGQRKFVGSFQYDSEGERGGGRG